MQKVTIIGNPISDNHLFATNFKTGRRFSTKKAEAFRKIAQASVRKPYTPFKGPCIAFVDLYFPDFRKRDVQGYKKALYDSMIGILYEDDSQIICEV